jgi:hypothetical protein
MAGLVPAIHAAVRADGSKYSAGAGRREGLSFEDDARPHGVDARNKSGHDGLSDDQTPILAPPRSTTAATERQALDYARK